MELGLMAMLLLFHHTQDRHGEHHFLYVTLKAPKGPRKLRVPNLSRETLNGDVYMFVQKDSVTACGWIWLR